MERCFLPLRIWGICLEYESVRGGITKLAYNSFSDVTCITYGLPFTAPVITTETGYSKFRAILLLIGRKPKKKTTCRRISGHRKEWRTYDARYDAHSKEGGGGE
jgi:hypothetical protein